MRRNGKTADGGLLERSYPLNEVRPACAAPYGVPLGRDHGRRTREGGEDVIEHHSDARQRRLEDDWFGRDGKRPLRRCLHASDLAVSAAADGPAALVPGRSARHAAARRSFSVVLSAPSRSGRVNTAESSSVGLHVRQLRRPVRRGRVRRHERRAYARHLVSGALVDHNHVPRPEGRGQLRLRTRPARSAVDRQPSLGTASSSVAPGRPRPCGRVATSSAAPLWTSCRR